MMRNLKKFMANINELLLILINIIVHLCMHFVCKCLALGPPCVKTHGQSKRTTYHFHDDEFAEAIEPPPSVASS